MLKRTSIATAAIVVIGAGIFFALEFPPAAHAQQKAGQTTAGTREQTITLAVENMTCGLCPVTVKKALSAVPGVLSVEVDFAAKTATVVFDPSATSAKDIAAASTDAGYPAKPAG